MPNLKDTKQNSAESKPEGFNKWNLLRYAIALAVGLLIAFVFMLAKSIFSETDKVAIMRILSDAFFLSGVLLTAAGLLLFASAGGAFDMLAYGFRMLFVMLRRDLSKRKYKDYYEYRQARQEKKRSIAYMLIVGLFMLALAALFLILFHNV